MEQRRLRPVPTEEQQRLQSASCVVFDAFRLDRRDERLWRGQEVIPLHPKTFAVLCCLVTQAGQLVTKDALLAAVWPETVVSEAVLTVAVRQLRRVLGDQTRTPRFIATVHGRGYRFIAPVSALAAPEEPGRGRVPRYVSSLTFSRPPHFVGRDAALAQMAQWWTTARQGTRQVGVIAGEPGIGKTALVATFVARVAATAEVWVGYGQCLDHYGAGEAYLPLLEALGRFCRGPEGGQFVAMLRQYAPSWLVQMPGLLPPADWEALQRAAGGATRPRMLRELTEALDPLTTERPLVLVVEDLQWSDMSTLAWLAYVARRPDPARLLILGTYRPVDAIVRAHPIRPMMTELTQHQQGAELVLDYLSAEEVTAYCGQRWRGQGLPEALTHVLHQRTRGHPLLLVTLVDEMRRQGLWPEEAAGGDVSKVVETIRGVVPESLRQIIAQHLHQVRPEDQGLLEAASIAGRSFSAAEVAAIVNQTTEDIEARFAILAHHRQFIESGGLTEWPDGTVAASYEFLHDLYRETLYDRIPPSRQRRWHLQIGIRKETGYGDRAREIAAELAVHFERGRDYQRAVQHRQQAADTALQRCAYAEVITHLTKGLALLETLPNTSERLQQELLLQTALGSALIATKGEASPDVEHAYTRAREVCRQVDDVPRLFTTLWGLRLFYVVRGELHTARELGEQLLILAQRVQDPRLLVGAHQGLGTVLFDYGEFLLGQAHLQQGITLSRHLQRGRPVLYIRDPGVVCHAFAALTLWFLGSPEQALQRGHEALTLAQDLADPFSLASALFWTALLLQCCRDVQEVSKRAEALVALATAHGFPHRMANGRVLHGWALSAQGQRAAALTQLHQGRAVYRATWAEQFPLHQLGLLAEAYGNVGQAEEGLRLLAELWATENKRGERYYKAELYRLQGELLLAQDGTRQRWEAEAEESFHQALAVARRQQAKSLELRAAISLSRLWQRQGKRDAARELLTEVYGWFTEGFATADLQEAKALLEVLA